MSVALVSGAVLVAFLAYCVGWRRGVRRGMEKLADATDAGVKLGDKIGRAEIAREVSARLLPLMYEAESTRQPIAVDVLRRIERDFNARGNA